MEPGRVDAVFLTRRDKEMQHFWSRWTREYLLIIAIRSKRVKSPEQVIVRNIVYLCDDDNRRGWKKGRIVETRGGDEGVIRRAIMGDGQMGQYTTVAYIK